MKNPVLNLFFKYDNINNRSECLVNDCKRFISEKHASNLEKHIFVFHNLEYQKLVITN
jgi:hypothetical protein